MTGRGHPPASVPLDHPAASLPRRRLAVLRPGMVVEGVITRLVRGGALVDIQLESGEPAFMPLSEIPAKAMPAVRELIASAALQPVRIVQLDRAKGTATVSVQGILAVEPEPKPVPVRAPVPAPEPPPVRRPETPPRARSAASERARKQQEELLRRLRGGG